jgi:hypothetical protein
MDITSIAVLVIATSGLVTAWQTKELQRRIDSLERRLNPLESVATMTRLTYR